MVANREYQTSGDYLPADRARFEKFCHDNYFDAAIAPLNPGEPLEFRIECEATTPFLVGVSIAATPFHFRREWHHIRKDRSDICILHLITDGSLRLVHNGQRGTITAGQFFLSRSSIPAEFDAYPGISGVHRHLHIQLSPDLVREHFGERDLLGLPITPSQGFGHVAHDLMRLLHERGQGMAPAVARTLLNAMLQELALLDTTPGALRQGRPSTIRERRLQTLFAYLELHVTNPDLDANMAAAACRITPRYMAMLLASRGTSFRQTVRELRIEKAQTWLQNPALSQEPIATLAYRAGFKTASHFVDVFKTRYGRTPGRFRQDCLLDRSAERSVAAPRATPDTVEDLAS